MKSEGEKAKRGKARKIVARKNALKKGISKKTGMLLNVKKVAKKGNVSKVFAPSPKKKAKIVGKNRISGTSKKIATQKKASKSNANKAPFLPELSSENIALLRFDSNAIRDEKFGINRDFGDSIKISNRLRLARNLAGHKFLKSATPEEKAFIFAEIKDAVMSLPDFAKGRAYRVGDMSESEKDALIEDGIISPDLSESGADAGACISSDNVVCVMINEEDHIRIQAISNELSLIDLYRRASDIDDQIERKLEYAFDTKLGYITACPTNLGTGMRASSMLHLPALVLSENMDKVVRGLNQLGATVRGANGEGSEPVGYFFQISNQVTLGISEENLISKIDKLTEKVRGFEINARRKLMRENSLTLIDKILRSKALLESCALVSSEEAVSLLSTLRLAADIGCMSGRKSVEEIDAVTRDIRPSRLSEIFCVSLNDTISRDALRATFLNRIFRAVGK